VKELSFPPRLSLGQLPTPLIPLRRLGTELGGIRLWVKCDDMSGCLVSGNKVRKLEFILAQARLAGCQVIITCGGVQSNHCRTTAALGAREGFKVHLALRGECPSQLAGNLLLDQLLDAEISFYSPSDYKQNLDQILVQLQGHYQARGEKAMIIPSGGSNATGVWGYVAACQELRQDFARAGIRSPQLITATGSGGTQAGLIAGNALFDLEATVWGVNVCDDNAYFQAKIRHDLEQWEHRYRVGLAVQELPIQLLTGYVGEGYGIADPKVWETIRWAARHEGLVLDPVYTGKAFHGLVQELRQGRLDPERDVIFVHTGGIYGLFAQHDRLAALLSRQDIPDAGSGPPG